jgi:hypothetical protein
MSLSSFSAAAIATSADFYSLCSSRSRRGDDKNLELRPANRRSARCEHALSRKVVVE